MDCIFCKIIAGEIPCHKVWEDENVLAFLDIHPCSKGHTVVVPKKHFENVGEIGPKEWEVLMGGVKATAGHVRTVLTPDGVNITINDGEAAGQSVPHAHWHIIPRYFGDGGGSMHSIVRSKDVIDVAEVAKLFS